MRTCVCASMPSCVCMCVRRGGGGHPYARVCVRPDVLACVHVYLPGMEINNVPLLTVVLGRIRGNSLGPEKFTTSCSGLFPTSACYWFRLQGVVDVNAVVILLINNNYTHL